MANSCIIKEPVFNYTSDFPFVWDEIVLPVKYGSNMQVARDVLQRLVKGVVGEYAIYAQKVWEKIVDKYMIEAAKEEPAITIGWNSLFDLWLTIKNGVLLKIESSAPFLRNLKRAKVGSRLHPHPQIFI